MKDVPFKVRFWGVRGSRPTPGGATLRYGGNTPCVEVKAAGWTIILDAGTGVIPLGDDLIQRAAITDSAVEAVMLFSHYHIDHLHGFPFFAPALLPSSRLWLFGPVVGSVDVHAALDGIMRPPLFPLTFADFKAALQFGSLDESSCLYLGGRGEGVALRQGPDMELEQQPDLVKVRVMGGYAHPGSVLHYRIECQDRSLVYATDTESYPGGNRRLAEFARGCDLLIHDAQYSEEHYLGLLPGMPATQGYGHSTISMACENAGLAKAHQLALFHHAPEYDDEELNRLQLLAQTQFAQAVCVYEGLEIDLMGANRRD